MYLAVPVYYPPPPAQMPVTQGKCCWTHKACAQGGDSNYGVGGGWWAGGLEAETLALVFLDKSPLFGRIVSWPDEGHDEHLVIVVWRLYVGMTGHRYEPWGVQIRDFLCWS
jgi:hypothetical protein